MLSHLYTNQLEWFVVLMFCAAGRFEFAVTSPHLLTISRFGHLFFIETSQIDMASSVDISNMSLSDKTTYTWTIDNFSSLDGDFQWSDDFLYRNGLVVDLALTLENRYFLKKNYLVYLGLHPNSTGEYNVYCQLSLLNQNGEKCNTKEGFVKIVNKVVVSNWHYTFSHAYLESNGFLVGNKLNIYCEVHVLDNSMMPSATKPLTIPESKHSTLMSDLVNLFESQKNSDVILVAGEKQFPAHKLILSSRSPVFAAMFEHECEESKQNRVIITDVDAETLEQLLRYIYMDKCSSLDQYSADLMVAADKYQIESLKAICCESLSTNLTVDSAVKLLLLSDMHSAHKLKENCVKYITAHSTEVNHQQWKALISAGSELSFGLFQSVANSK